MFKKKMKFALILFIAFVLQISALNLSAAVKNGEESNNDNDTTGMSETTKDFINSQISGKRGLVGFEGDDTLPSSGDVSVIVEFMTPPAKVLQATENLSAKKARSFAASDLNTFESELNTLFRKRSAGSYEITNVYENAINGVAITVPADKVEQIAKFTSVKNIYPNSIVQHDPIDLTILSDNAYGMAAERDYLGIDELHAAGITGKGITVAILDTGIDYNHPDFANAFLDKSPTNEVSDLLNGKFYGRNYIYYTSGMQDLNLPTRGKNDPMETTLADLKATSNPETKNGSMFYTAHGTHVAGTVAANGDASRPHAIGMAPDAKIYSYRVLGPYGSGYLSWIMEGIEQVAIDKPNVVNMSLGNGNNSAYTVESLAISNIMLANEDISFVIAAGNSGSEMFTMGDPGITPVATTVGNGYVGSKDALLHVNVGSSAYTLTHFYDAWGSTIKTNTDGKLYMSYEGVHADSDYAYKMFVLPSNEDASKMGIGSEADYLAATPEFLEAIKGNVVLVNRGNFFTDTMAIAKKYEVGMVLLVNNDTPFDTISDYRGEALDGLPFYVIPKTEGLQIVDQIKNGVDTFTISSVSGVPGGTLAASSSRGPVNGSYEIKPDIVAPGTSILSTAPSFITSPDDTSNYEYAYQRMNGTSMASPHVAGITALMMGYSKDNQLGWNALDVRTLLMNNSSPMNGDYSVYEVGSGFVNPKAALEAATKVTTTRTTHLVSETNTLKAEEIQSGSINFGSGFTNNEITKSKTITIENKSNTAKTYQLSSTFNTVGQLVKDANEAGVTLTLSETSVTVPAHGTKDVVVTIYSPATTTPDHEGSFEGYVVIESQSETQRMPFALFLESGISGLSDLFINQPVISANEDTRQLMNSSNSSLYYSMTRPYEAFDFAVTTASNPNEILGLLGNTFTTVQFQQLDTLYYVPQVITMHYFPAVYDEDGELLGFENRLVPFEEGAYYFDLYAYYKNRTDVYSVPFYVSNTAPDLTIDGLDKALSAVYYPVGAETVTITGNIYDSAVQPMIDHGVTYDIYEAGDGVSNDPSQAKNGLFVKVGDNYLDVAVSEEGNYQFEVPTNAGSIKMYAMSSFGYSQISGATIYDAPEIAPNFNPALPSFKTGDNGGYFGVNKTVVDVKIEANQPQLYLSNQEVTLELNNTVTITPTFNVKATGDQVAQWTSSNPEIATVDQNGVITAISKGDATITVTSKKGLTATVLVHSIYSANIGVHLEAGTQVEYGSFKHLLNIDHYTVETQTNYLQIIEGSQVYETTPTPIVWEVKGHELVNGKKEEATTIMSKYILDVRQYAPYYADYKESLLRTYLNNEFTNNFTTTELSTIPNYNVENKLFIYENFVSPLYNFTYENEKFYIPFMASLFPDFGNGLPGSLSILWSAKTDLVEENSIVYKNQDKFGVQPNINNVTKGGSATSYVTRTIFNEWRIDGIYGTGENFGAGLTASDQLGFKPITKLDLNQVVITREVTGYDKTTNKLTILGQNGGVNIGTLNGLDASKRQEVKGNDLVITGVTPSIQDANHLVGYKVIQVIDGTETIVASGTQASTDVNQLIINTKNLELGDYVVYAWLEKVNEVQSNEAGVITRFDVSITNQANKELITEIVAEMDSFNGSIDASKFDVNHVKAFEDALAHAKAVIENPNSTQREVEEAIQMIMDAFTKLVENPKVVDVTKADELLLSISKLNKKDYTTESWNALMDAKANLEALINPFKRSLPVQDQIDQAVAALKEALNKLVKINSVNPGEKEVPEVDPNKPGEKVTPEVTPDKNLPNTGSMSYAPMIGLVIVGLGIVILGKKKEEN